MDVYIYIYNICIYVHAFELLYQIIYEMSFNLCMYMLDMFYKQCVCVYL